MARDIGAVGGPGGERRIEYREWVRRKSRLGDFHNYFKSKTAPISASVLEDFVTCYHAENRSRPGEAGRFRASASTNSVPGTGPTSVSSGSRTRV
jgi:hypothetical protein